jgi:hypothetical protein
MISHIVAYAFFAILAIGAWAELRGRPKKTAANIGKWRARTAKRAAEHARLDSKRAIVEPVQRTFWL